MTLNHNRIRQVLHVITVIAFSISIFFQLRNLYIYGGKPSKQLENDDIEDDTEMPEDDREITSLSTTKKLNKYVEND